MSTNACTPLSIEHFLYNVYLYKIVRKTYHCATNLQIFVHAHEYVIRCWFHAVSFLLIPNVILPKYFLTTFPVTFSTTRFWASSSFLCKSDSGWQACKWNIKPYLISSFRKLVEISLQRGEFEFHRSFHLKPLLCKPGGWIHFVWKLPLITISTHVSCSRHGVHQLRCARSQHHRLPNPSWSKRREEKPPRIAEDTSAGRR